MTTNPINKYGLFDTPTTYNDLLQWCEQHTGSEKTIAIVAAHMALNLAHHINQQNINEGEGIEGLADNVAGALRPLLQKVQQAKETLGMGGFDCVYTANKQLEPVLFRLSTLVEELSGFSKEN